MPAPRRSDFLSLYVSPSSAFLSIYRPYQRAKYVILGVPYDATASFRTGARFAPSSIREASLNLESYSLLSHIDVEEVPFCDLGNIDTVQDPEQMVRRVEECVRQIRKDNKIPILLGGEHTITLGALKAIVYPKGEGGPKLPLFFVAFDAHADMRDEYLGQKVCHATVLRRIAELVGYENVFLVGTRAFSKEEIEFVRTHGIRYVTPDNIREMGVDRVLESIRYASIGHTRIYLSIDMDVLDPAYAPGVETPEPCGLSPRELLSLLQGLCGSKVVGVDIVEVAPHYDNGLAALHAAKVLLEVLGFLEQAI